MFVVSFPGSKKASYENACLLGSDAVPACFATFRRKGVVSLFSEVEWSKSVCGTILCGTLFIAVAGARVLLRIRAAQHITCVSEHSTVYKSLMIYTAPSSSRRRILVDRYRRTSKWHLTVCAESVGCNEYYLH